MFNKFLATHNHTAPATQQSGSCGPSPTSPRLQGRQTDKCCGHRTQSHHDFATARFCGFQLPFYVENDDLSTKVHDSNWVVCARIALLSVTELEALDLFTPFSPARDGRELCRETMQQGPGNNNSHSTHVSHSHCRSLSLYQAFHPQQSLSKDIKTWA